MRIRYIIILLAAASLTLACNQAVENDKTAHSQAIDLLYQQFSKAYETLDLDLVSSLYTADARFLTRSPNQVTLDGREAIRASFASYFEWAKNNNRHINISFRIVERRIADSLAYDTGYYLLKSKPKEAQEFVDEGSVGKFVTVMGLQPDGSWKFLLDGDSPAPYDAFFADSTAHDPAIK